MKKSSEKHFNFVDHTGELHITNEGYTIEIVNYRNHADCDVLIKENNCIIKNRQYTSVKTGTIRNPYHPSVCNIGYFGEGVHKSKIDGKKTKVYTCWNAMIKRCYNENSHKKHPTYIDVEVCEEWHNFQNFSDWFEENYVEGWDLDKDIICPDCKEYSPKNCTFVPREINNIFCSRKGKDLPIGVVKGGKLSYKSLIRVGNSIKYLGTFDNTKDAFEIYKTTKEKYIKRLANKYENELSKEVYNILINFQIKNI